MLKSNILLLTCVYLLDIAKYLFCRTKYCQYFVIWSKYTHVSKSIFTLRSHANSVHSILKGTHNCCTADMYRLFMTAAILFVHWSCTYSQKNN